MADHNALVISFTDRSKAFEAFSTLKNLAAEERFRLVGAQLITRDENNRLINAEGVDTETGTGALGGGLIGMLVGMLGGPIGMLFGWTGGALIGLAADSSRIDRATGLLGEVSKEIPLGGSAIVAEAEEFTNEVIDDAMAPLGGTVHRRPAMEVLAEMEAAEDAYRQAEKEADRIASEKRKAERNEDFHERVAQLKEKLGFKDDNNK